MFVATVSVLFVLPAFASVSRHRLEFGMINDESTSLSDPDLLSLVREIHSQSPSIGASMVWGYIRARG